MEGNLKPDYDSYSPEALLAALERAGRLPDLALIRACMAQREALTPGLLRMLVWNPDESEEWDEEDPRWYREIHAGLLLIHFREEAALPLFGKIMRDEQLDTLKEWFDTELAAYGPAAIPMLSEVLSDRSAYDYARSSATDILSQIARRHPEERERIVEALRAQLPPLALLQHGGALEQDVTWTWVMVALTELRDEASRPQVVALFEAELIDETIMGGLEDYLADMEGRERLAPREYRYDILERYQQLHEQARRDREWRAEAAKRAANPPPPTPPPGSLSALYAPPAPQTPFVRETRKVGRNDPCPCGSGRKYKKCHGK